MQITLKNIKQIIPKNPKINGSEDFIKTAVLVILIKINNEWEILFEKRAKSISQGGEISFPGGKFDANFDLTAKDTAIRETIEETGISKDSLIVIGELDSILAPIGVMIRPFLASSDIEKIPKNYNTSEVENLFSVPVKWFIDNPPLEYATILKAHPYEIDKRNNIIPLLPAKELGLPEKYNAPWGKLKQKVFVYKYNNEIIWGLTARIVNSLIKNLVQYTE